MCFCLIKVINYYLLMAITANYRLIFFTSTLTPQRKEALTMWRYVLQLLYSKVNRQCPGWYRPVRVLHQRGVGHPPGPGRETCQGLRLLSGALPG